MLPNIFVLFQRLTPLAVPNPITPFDTSHIDKILLFSRELISPGILPDCPNI